MLQLFRLEFHNNPFTPFLGEWSFHFLHQHTIGNQTQILFKFTKFADRSWSNAHDFARSPHEGQTEKNRLSH